MDLEQELEIVSKAKTNLQAFNELYEYYLPKIFGYCYNRLPKRDIAEEITSEVFLVAVEKLPKFDTRKNIKFGSWLFTVAHNKIVDYYRQHKNIYFIDDINEGDASVTQDFDKDVNQIEVQTKVAYIISLLKESYQQILTLRYYAEMDNEEIAKSLGIKTQNVALLIHRAQKAFKDKFQQNYPNTDIFHLL